MLELDEVHTLIRVSHHFAPDIDEEFLTQGTVVVEQFKVVFISQTGQTFFVSELLEDIEKYDLHLLTGDTLSRTWNKAGNFEFIISPVLLFALIDINVNTMFRLEI
jgi:hypothetical protein